MKTLNLFAMLFMITGFSFAEKMTMRYGGDWTNTTMIQNDNFMSMTGAFVGTNVMMLGKEEIRTNFICTGLYQTEPAAMLMGSCNMKQAGTNDYWVLNWKCSTTGSGKEKCKGKAIGGTGRFAGVTGEMTWIDSAGFGEGGGTFNLKN